MILSYYNKLRVELYGMVPSGGIPYGGIPGGGFNEAFQRGYQIVTPFDNIPKVVLN